MNGKRVARVTVRESPDGYSLETIADGICRDCLADVLLQLLAAWMAETPATAHHHQHRSEPWKTEQ